MTGTSVAKIRVVVVDDAPEVLRFMRHYIDREDRLTIVGEAETGVEGLRLVQELHPDVLLLDLVMPEMDGLDVLRELRSNDGRQPKVIIVSSSAAADAEQACVRLGAERYLEKSKGFEQVPGVILEVAEIPT
ncbi:MAG: response regulator [Nitriliruptorales bacterium]|nr:response regulator [Nitriliruptorales bacterium]